MFNNTLILLLIATSCGQSQSNLKGDNCRQKYDNNLKKMVYSYVEEKPQYPGGDIELLKFITSSLEYPEQKVYQGSINLSFVVDKDGYLLDKKIQNKNIKEYSPLDRKALEVLDKMSRWKAGKCQGKKVPVRVILPIKL